MRHPLEKNFEHRYENEAMCRQNRRLYFFAFDFFEIVLIFIPSYRTAGFHAVKSDTATPYPRIIAATAEDGGLNEGASMDLSSCFKPSGSGVLNDHQVKQLLKQYGIPLVREHLATDADEAVRAARDMGYPVVVKGVGAQLLHKTEMGLVRQYLGNESAVRQAAVDIRQRAGDKLEGLLVQPQVMGQRELLMGLFRDPQFGPVVTFGLGGVLTEALDDIAMAVAPLTEADAREMIGQVKAQKLLAPFRGEQAVDTGMLVDIALGLSRLSADHPEISEVDINPLRVTPHGALLAVDALIVAKTPEPEENYVPPVPPAALARPSPK